jgi:hypothetical protein
MDREILVEPHILQLRYSINSAQLRRRPSDARKAACSIRLIAEIGSADTSREFLCDTLGQIR